MVEILCQQILALEFLRKMLMKTSILPLYSVFANLLLSFRILLPFLFCYCGDVHEHTLLEWFGKRPGFERCGDGVVPTEREPGGLLDKGEKERRLMELFKDSLS